MGLWLPERCSRCQRFTLNRGSSYYCRHVTGPGWGSQPAPQERLRIKDRSEQTTESALLVRLSACDGNSRTDKTPLGSRGKGGTPFLVLWTWFFLFTLSQGKATPSAPLTLFLKVVFSSSWLCLSSCSCYPGLSISASGYCCTSMQAGHLASMQNNLGNPARCQFLVQPELCPPLLA